MVPLVFALEPVGASVLEYAYYNHAVTVVAVVADVGEVHAVVVAGADRREQDAE